MRLSRILRDKAGRVEVAYDKGVIRAGALELPICEIEFELIAGPLETIFTLGKRWQQKFGLLLDARSKAERGDRLAQLDKTLTALDALDASESEAKRITAIASFWAPQPVSAISLDPKDNAQQALRAVSAECLDQIIRNSAIIAGVDTEDRYADARSEHVHQLRVGIRRLRSAWSFFNGLAELPALARTHFANFAQSGSAPFSARADCRRDRRGRNRSQHRISVLAARYAGECGAAFCTFDRCGNQCSDSRSNRCAPAALKRNAYASLGTNARPNT
jgi:inorganic triphosphatase YgiF